MIIAAVRRRIADTRRLTVAATTVVATTNRLGRTALLIAAVIVSHPDPTVLTIVEAIVSLHGLMDRMVGRVSALIRVRPGLALLR